MGGEHLPCGDWGGDSWQAKDRQCSGPRKEQAGQVPEIGKRSVARLMGDGRGRNEAVTQEEPDSVGLHRPVRGVWMCSECVGKPVNLNTRNKIKFIL